MEPERQLSDNLSRTLGRGLLSEEVAAVPISRAEHWDDKAEALRAIPTIPKTELQMELATIKRRIKEKCSERQRIDGE